MKKWLKAVSSLTVAAVIALPTSVFASPDLKAKALVDADVKVNGTTIEVNANVKAKGLVDSGGLLRNGEFRIVDQTGKVLYVKKGADVKLNAKIENLKPRVEYCLDVQVKGKVLDNIELNVGAKADQKIKLLNKNSLIKIKNGHLCVTTGDPGDQGPNNPNQPKPEQPNPGPNQPDNPNPVSPKEPDNPKQPQNPKQSENPKQQQPSDDKPAKDQPKIEKEEPSFLDWILGWF